MGYNEELSTNNEYLENILQRVNELPNAVPETRTINGKALSENIELTAGDVGAAPISHASTETTYGISTDAKYGHVIASSATPKMNGTASVGSETAKFARGDHVHPSDESRVPTIRKINNKALSSDISLSASDVGADASGTASSTVSTHNSSTSAHSELFNKKQNIPASATALPASGTALTNNTIYTVSAAVGTYQFVAPASGWAHGTFATGTSVAITFASGAKFISETPEFTASTAYEFDVLNGVWVFAKVVTE